MTTIKFDRWWAKLDTPVGFVFTTIRRYTREKLAYYKDNIGNIFDVEVSDTKNGFKGFEKTEYILLIFEVIDKFVKEGKINIKTKLLFATVKGYEDIPKELIEYDTKYLSLPPLPKVSGIREDSL